MATNNAVLLIYKNVIKHFVLIGGGGGLNYALSVNSTSDHIF